MADFNLTQTDQQVQNILNDGQSAMGAGAQTTLTTEYVMLKDTNGVYHKILKDSLTEACRNVLAGLLVNNDKGTTISQLPAIASGDFGSVTPANLASVLGGRIKLGLVGTGSSYLDANTLPLNSIGNCSPLSSNVTNYPPGVSRGEIETIDMGAGGDTIMQKFWERGGDSSRQYVALYVRCKTGGSWYEWRKTTFDTYTV